MTKIWFENECDFCLPDTEGTKYPEIYGDPEQCAVVTADAALRYEGLEEDAEVSLTIVDAENMRTVNRLERGIDAVTDVLSFPAFAYTKPAAFQEALDDPLAKDPDTGRLILGDILICADRVHSQAEEYGHSEVREYAFLITHSILHLIGYDHMTEADAEEMFRRQEEILAELGIFREMP